jgi:hypothetical protein
MVNKQKTEREKITEIRKAAIEEVKRLKKEGKSITTNAVEVVCTEEDIFHTKSKKKKNSEKVESETLII